VPFSGTLVGGVITIITAISQLPTFISGCIRFVQNRRETDINPKSKLMLVTLFAVSGICASCGLTIESLMFSMAYLRQRVQYDLICRNGTVPGLQVISGAFQEGPLIFCFCSGQPLNDTSFQALSLLSGALEVAYILCMDYIIILLFAIVYAK
jgi:hypothetical protein